MIKIHYIFATPSIYYLKSFNTYRENTRAAITKISISQQSKRNESREIHFSCCCYCYVNKQKWKCPNAFKKIISWKNLLCL